jgi:predicted unusual protein kinase regulating ubiquinone biosynthesis (AarF/ABC1/UbiB family)
MSWLASSHVLTTASYTLACSSSLGAQRLDRPSLTAVGVVCAAACVCVRQRPDMLPGILLDLYLLRKCVPLLKKNKNLNTDLVAVVDEWGVRFVDELDYRREAANATQFGEAMRARGLTSLCTAEVVHGLTSQRVLTTEWVDGTRLDESDKGDEARLCGIALNGYLTMLLDTGVLHADPHPGNLLRTTDGRLCILDFGLVTELTQEQQYSIIEYIAHLISENYIRVPGDLSRLGFVPKVRQPTPCQFSSFSDDERTP